MRHLERWRPLLNPLRYLITGGLLFYLVWKADPAQIWEKWHSVDLRLIGLALLLQFLGIALSAAKWGMLLKARNRDQPYGWLLSTYLVGQFANNFLPTTVGGDAVRVVQLGKRVNSFSQASASVFIDRLTGFLALSLIANMALVLTYVGLGGYQFFTSIPFYIATVGFTIAAILAVAMCFSAPWLQQKFGAYVPQFAQYPLQRITTSLADFFPQGGWLIVVLAMSLSFQSLWVIINAVCGMALDIQAPLLIYALMAPITDVVGLIPVFVNNMGARELVFTLYLTQIGVSPATALALAFLILSVRLVVSILGGVIMFFGGADLRSMQMTRDTLSRKPS
jgi:uncharacterized protein (TIRG00374 family)